MNNSKNILIKQVEKYLGFLSNLQTEDISKLERGESIVRFEIVNANKKQKVKNGTLNFFSKSIFNPELIISDMLKLSTREEGDQYLMSKCSTKDDFIIIAKKLDLPFERKDSVEKIKSKIIETTIGFRLRSQAIQG